MSTSTIIERTYGTQDVSNVLSHLSRIGIADFGSVCVKVVQDPNLTTLNKNYIYSRVLLTNSRPGNLPEIDTWIDWLHAINHAPYTVHGARSVFLAMAREILRTHGLNRLSACLLSAAWAVHYGQWLYFDKYGYFPTDPHKFIEEALAADDLEGII